MEGVTNELNHRLRTFIRSTLGCACPDEVLEWIHCTHTDLDQTLDIKLTRIDVGGRLLVYVLATEDSGRSAEDALPAVIAAATVDRASGCFNRLRIVVATDDPESLRPRLERRFRESAPLDDRLHLHVVQPSELPFD
jgi:hypothetical protein